jgi:hypothetical protein
MRRSDHSAHSEIAGIRLERQALLAWFDNRSIRLPE